MELLANGSGDILFFRDRDGPPIPTLKPLHKYPFLLKPQQVDKGAIRFILSGANIMCPGLTSPGANMIDAAADEIVAIYAEGGSVDSIFKAREWTSLSSSFSINKYRRSTSDAFSSGVTPKTYLHIIVLFVSWYKVCNTTHPRST